MVGEGPPAQSPAIGLRLLHPAALLFADGRERRLSTSNAAMLTLLACRGTVSRVNLAQWLYPGSDLGLAKNALRQRAFKLARSAGMQLLEGDGDDVRLPRGLTHDLANPYASLRSDGDALRAPLMPEREDGLTEPMLDELRLEQQRWRRRLDDALVRLATEQESHGRLAVALSLTTRLVGTDPLGEHGVRLLMRLHYRRGDHGAALQAYQDCCSAMAEELDEVPSPETTALAEQIRRAAVQDATPVAPIPLWLRHPPQTVGRSDVLTQAEERWATCAAVLLTGPAGIGKTRVFDELVGRWGVGVVVRLQAGGGAADHALLGSVAAALLQRWPDADETSPPDLEAALRWLAQPSASPAPAGPIHRQRLTTLVGQALAECGRRGIDAIAIDDLHFADVDSLEVLQSHWTARSAGLRWLLTCRSTDLPLPVARWLADAEDPLDPQVAVGELGSGALAELLTAVQPGAIDPSRWAPALHAHCGGHPLSVLQVLRALHDRGRLQGADPPDELPIPQDARRRVARQLDSGDERAQMLAFVVALAGGEFDADLAAAVVGCKAVDLIAPWRRLQALGVLDGVRFSHELMRQAVLESLPAALAPALHRDIAQALADRQAPPAVRALHWEAALDWRRAGSDLLLAAKASLAAGLSPKGRTLLQHAAELFDRGGLQAEAFDARWRAGRLTLDCISAAQARSDAEQLRLQASGVRQQCLADCLLAQVATEQHDVAALMLAERAMALARQLDEPTMLTRARIRYANALRVSARNVEAVEVLRALGAQVQALPAEERADAEDAMFAVLGAVGRRSEVVALAQKAVAESVAGDDLERAVNASGQLALSLASLGLLRRAIAAIEQTIELARRSGVEAGYVLLHEMSLSGFLADVGEYDRALELGERSLEALRAGAYTPWVFNAEHSQAGLFMRLGRSDLALRMLSDAPAEAPTWCRAARLVWQARWAHARGQPALQLLQEAIALLDGGGAVFNTFNRQRIELDLARVVAPDEALQRIADCRAWLRENEELALDRVAAWIEVETLLRGGQRAAAARQADALADAIGDAWETPNVHLPDLWWTLVSAWDAAGLNDRASTIARQASAWIDLRSRCHVPPAFASSFRSGNDSTARLLRRTVTQR